MCNLTLATYPNDSKLEQAVIYAEKNIAAGAGTIGALPSAATAGGASGGANV
jgi:hypothetical protein